MRSALVSLLLAALAGHARADVVADARALIASGDWDAAHKLVATARKSEPRSPAPLEAQSWLARGELQAGKLDAAQADARATRAGVVALLQSRKLDDEPRLPIALGAAIEVEAQVLAQHGQRNAAVAQLQTDHARYADTSIATRIQKNLNLLALVGQTAPALTREPHFGHVAPSLTGKPLLLFFWAHWCGDCKGMAPVIARLQAELAPRGLIVVAPTQTYGEPSEAEAERAHIDDVRHAYYAALEDAPTPVSNDNFARYGASTVPTIVLVDRAGKVVMYHPGAMSYAELAPQVTALVR